MKFNYGKKLISTLVIGLQVSSFAFADGTTARVDDSNERTLLINLIGLEGQSMSKDAYLAKANDAINAYQSAASTDLQSERFSQAVVDLGLMEPSQAENVKASIGAKIGSALASNPDMNEAQRHTLVADATYQVLNHSFAGAQFSACAGVGLGAATILATAIMGDVYAATLIHTTSVSTVSYNYNGSGGQTTNTSGDTTTTTTVTTTSGSTTTNVTTVSGNQSEKTLIEAGSGIAYGIAGVMFIYMMASDDLCT
jgi:hypothetical protein